MNRILKICSAFLLIGCEISYNIDEQRINNIESELGGINTENPFQGEFTFFKNIPYGLKDRKNIPGIIDETHMYNLSELIKDVTFVHSSFENSIKQINANDFVYLDPPYAPESASSFVGYTKDGFNYEQHVKLFNMCDDLVKNGKCLIMSNADVEIVGNHLVYPSL